MIRVHVLGRGGTLMHEIVVAGSQRAQLDFPQPVEAWSLVFMNGYADEPSFGELRARLADAEAKLEKIRAAGEWDEAEWDE